MELPLRAARPVTPPPTYLPYLLTPPPSGGFDGNASSGDTLESSKIVYPTETGEHISLPSTPHPSKLRALDEHNLPEVPEFSLTEQSFPFMRLPISVQHNIYKLLLTLPGLICVRQNYEYYHDSERYFLKARDRELLPGIAHAFVLTTVGERETAFDEFDNINVNILRVSKEVHAEAKAILYGKNAFEIVRPSLEMSPKPDFRIRLFPHQNLVTNLNIRIHSFYGLDWLINCRYNDFKSYYRGIGNLTLILELNNCRRGLGKKWLRAEDEGHEAYIQRLHTIIANGISSGARLRKKKAVPSWIDLRVLFSGEAYDPTSTRGIPDNEDFTIAKEHSVRELRASLVLAWDSFKR